MPLSRLLVVVAAAVLTSSAFAQDAPFKLGARDGVFEPTVIEVPAVESKAIEESGPSQVPEPPSLLLVAGGLAWLRRNRRPLLRE